MKKWTAITDGGKYGVQAATTIKIREGMTASFSPSPRYLRTQGLELLPDGEEFEAILVKQVGNIRGLKPLKLEWTDATPEEEWEKLLPEYRRQVLAPLVNDQDEPSVPNEWDSNRIIGRVRDRFKELEAKGWDWRSFYSGWLEGRTDMFAQIKEIGRYKPSNER